MNRRGFLGLVGAGAAGFVIDPERLLWRPGAKTIFLPTLTDTRYYDSHSVDGRVSRGDRITAARYSQLLGKQVLWREESIRDGYEVIVTFATVEPIRLSTGWVVAKENG